MGWNIEAKSSEEAFRKTMKITRVIGLLPLNDKCDLELKWICTSALMISYLSGSTLTLFFQYDHYLSRYTTTHKYIYYGRKGCSITTHFTIILWYIYKRRGLKKISDNLKIIQSTLASMNRKWNWYLQPAMYLGNVLLTIFVYLIENLEVTDNLSRILHWTFLYYDLLLGAIFINQFGAFYDLMGYCLKEVLATKNYDIYPKMYTIIEESCEVLNEIYSPSIFLILTLYFIDLLHQLYQAFGVYNKPSYITFVLLVCIVYYSVLIMQVTFIANNISSETKKFNSTIYNELIQNENKNLLANDRLLFHFERFKEFEFTANGFFSVNMSLLCSMILACTTYLVIFLQYSSSSYRSVDQNTNKSA